MENKCTWIPFYYYIISYNLCTTDCLVDYLYSIILQMGHPKCLPEFSWADHLACVCFVTMNNSPPWFMQPQCCLHLWEDAAVQHTSLCHWEHDWHPFWQVPDTVYTLPFSSAIWPGHRGKKTVAIKRAASADIQGAEQTQPLTKSFVKAFCLESVFSRPVMKNNRLWRATRSGSGNQHLNSLEWGSDQKRWI